MNVYFDSHVGNVRNNNEDSVLATELAGGVRLLIVADGVGGEKKGEVASALAVDCIGGYLKERSTELSERIDSEDFVLRSIRDAIYAAEEKIYTLAKEDEYFRMATTVVLALIHNEKAFIANVGDSRCYLLKKNSKKASLTQISKDNSLVQEMVDLGLITEAEAKRHSQRHKITRAVGMGELPSVDTYCVEWEPSDILLLCSDGLSDMLEDNEIEAVMRKGKALKSIVDNLIKKALEKGGVDNITVLCAKNGEVRNNG